MEFRVYDNELRRYRHDVEFFTRQDGKLFARIDGKGLDVNIIDTCNTTRLVVEEYINLDYTQDYQESVNGKEIIGRKIFVGDLVSWDDASKGRYWRVAECIKEAGHFSFRIIPELCVNCFKGRGEENTFKLGCFIYCPDTAKLGNQMFRFGNIHDYEKPETSEVKKETL